MAEDVKVKPGVETSEYKKSKSNSLMAIIIMVLGGIGTIGAVVAQSLGVDSKIGVIVGAVVLIAGVISKTLGNLGYIKSRTEVKAAASIEAAAKIDPLKPGG